MAIPTHSQDESADKRRRKAGTRYPRNFDGSPLGVSNLPPRKDLNIRWTATRKATVLLAVEQGVITIQEAEDWYYLGIEEYLEWRINYNEQGLEGLKERS